MVVRSLDKPAAEGFPVPPGASTSLDATFHPAEISTQLSTYLDSYEQQNDRFGPIKFLSKQTRMNHPPRPGILRRVPPTDAAAPPPPVHWSVKASPAHPLKPRTPFTVTIAAAIDPGWHLYALEEPEGGPIATQVSITEGDPADLLAVDQSKPRTLNDPLFSAPTSFFTTSAQFTLRLRLASALPAGDHPLHLLLRYQSCNDHVCLPPHTDSLIVPLQTTP